MIMKAFDIALSLFMDEVMIEFEENKDLPQVFDPYNPFDFHMKYRDETWIVTGSYWLNDESDQYITIQRAYTNDLLASYWLLYKKSEDFS